MGLKEKEKFFQVLKIERRKRNFSPILENREENETWKLASRKRERKIWVISLREFLEIETLVNVCHFLTFLEKT